MEAKIICYNGEKYERKIWRYAGASLLYITVIIMSLATENIFGVVLLILFLGGYIYYNFIDIYKPVVVVANDAGLQVANKQIPWNEVDGFALEYNTKTGQIMTIILQVKKQYFIHSLQSPHDEIELFGVVMRQYAPQLEKLELSTLEKLTRKLMI